MFLNNTASEIYAANSEIIIDNTKFYGDTKGGKDAPFIYATITSVTMTGSTMRDSVGETVRGIECDRCRSVTIDDSFFIGLKSSTTGAALYLDKTNCITVTKSTFFEVSAEKGPTIYVVDSYAQVDQETKYLKVQQDLVFENKEFWPLNHLEQVVAPKKNGSISPFLQLLWLECSDGIAKRNTEKPYEKPEDSDETICDPEDAS